MSSDDCIYVAKDKGLWYVWHGWASVGPRREDAGGLGHTHKECADSEADRLDEYYQTEYGVEEVEFPEEFTFDRAVDILVNAGTDYGEGQEKVDQAIEYLRSVCRTT